MFKCKQCVEFSDKLFKELSEKLTAEAKYEASLKLIEDKEAQIKQLNSQISSLQEALVAATAPKAYEDRKYDEEEAKNQEQNSQARDRAKKEARINAELLHETEQPLFKSADDMIEKLMGKNFELPSSLHENMES